jgi:hypothetical protein
MPLVPVRARNKDSSAWPIIEATVRRRHSEIAVSVPPSTGARPVDSGSGGDDLGVKQAIGGSAQAAPACCKRLPLTARRSRLASSPCACR